MKKMLAMVLLLLSGLVLSGCIEQDPTVEIPVNAGKINVEVISVDEVTLFSKTLIIDLDLYEDTSSIDLFEVLDDALDLDYEVYSFGTFIKGVEQHYPLDSNYWFSIYINDQMSHVGLSEIPFMDEMKISFIESTMLDLVDQHVDKIIYHFIEAYGALYVNHETQDYFVTSALALLFNAGYPVKPLTNFVSQEDMQSLYGNPEYGNVSEAFKSIAILSKFGMMHTVATSFIELAEPASPYANYAALLGALLSNSEEEVIQRFSSPLLGSDPEWMDADYASMAILALAPLKGNSAVDDKIEALKLFVMENVNEQGVEAWGTTNAASTASFILALVALGENPRSESYQFENTFTEEKEDLITALKAFEVQGAFRYGFTDENVDMLFSTPQGFAALAAYKVYRDAYVKVPVHIFLG